MRRGHTEQEAKLARWKKTARQWLASALRQRSGGLLPGKAVRDYQASLAKQKEERRKRYTLDPEPGLFSILTAVWDGSPLRYLRALAASIAAQNEDGATEWVLLDNGCRTPELRGWLAAWGARPWAKLVRSEENLGILRGLRRCLGEAQGRYVLPVDGDDLLDNDALRVVASAVRDGGYPPLLYTDEDKIAGKRRYDAYRKPPWDPVLLLNSAYIAHLGVIDREIALALGAYTDPAAEGSPDWDLFIRFLLAGYSAVHIPEIVYSWRAHGASTADDSANKPYIARSQRAVLQRYLDGVPHGALFSLEPSRLWKRFGGEHWHFVRRREGARPNAVISAAAATAEECRREAQAMADENGLVFLLDEGLRIAEEDWLWEAQGLMELHPETAMVGGRIWNTRGEILEAGLLIGDGGEISNPQRGRRLDDPGYFGQMWKQRSVDAVSTRLAVVEARFLLAALADIAGEASVSGLGPHLGLYARKMKRRVVYSPFVGGEL